MSYRKSLDDELNKYKPKGQSHKTGKLLTGPTCFESHPKLVMPGSSLGLYGGSCTSPAVVDADVYIGFDRGMRMSRRHWPWMPGHEVLFPIGDMGIPADLQAFGKLLDWTGERLAEGLKIHCGCIGGHGRTGMFLSALVRVTTGETDAIDYVRAHYCKRAVESDKQIQFLKDRFGIKGVVATKSVTKTKFTSSKSSLPPSDSRLLSTETIRPLTSAVNIWTPGVR